MSLRGPAAWIGYWIFAVGALHFLLGFIFYERAWQAIWAKGVVASIDDYNLTATAFWFAAVGPLLMLLGALVAWAERNGYRLPSWLGWSMAVLLVLLIIPMPVTGAWLLVPPVLALLFRGHSSSSQD